MYMIGKKRKLIHICVLSFLFILVLTCEALSNNTKADMIRQKTKKILSLRTTITKYKEQSIILCGQLNEQIRELKKEIKSEQSRLKINSYSRAITCPRIHNNLKLIQQLISYVSKLNEKTAYFQTGTDKLEFLYQQADDALRIIETLKDMKVDKLVDQIDQALREYLPETGKFLINVDNIPLRDPKNIWNNIMNS